MADPAPQVIAADDPSTYFFRPDNYVPDRSIGFLMRRVIGSIVQQVDARLACHDMTYVQWLPLYKMRRQGAINCADLSKGLGMDPASVTRALDRLEAKGLARRERSQADRRVNLLVLTEEGQRIADQVPPVLIEVLNAHLAGFSHAECEQMRSMLERMLANGEAMSRTTANTLDAPAPGA